jgi:uncharacterized protein (TIGR03067 family)
MVSSGPDLLGVFDDRDSWVIVGETVATEQHLWPDRATIRLEPSAEPPAIDIQWSLYWRPELDIYKLEGDSLTLCISRHRHRPREFSAKFGQGNLLVVFRRVKK